MIDDCEFAKYAPSATSFTPSEIYHRGVEIINNLEDSFNTSDLKK